MIKNLKELEAKKAETLAKIQVAEAENGIRVLVGMATCGMAAGAKPVFETLSEEVKTRNLNNVRVKSTGCVGVCRLEPIVEVIDSEGRKVTYINMTPEKTKRVVAEHIVNNSIVQEYTIGYGHTTGGSQQ